MAIVIARTLTVYFALLLTMRLMGKRQLGEMELSEFVVAALIADLASHPLQDMGIPLLNGLVPIAVLFCCEVLIAGLSMRCIRLRTLFFGKPSLLIVKGEINQTEMRRNRFTTDELLQELRSQGVIDIASIEYAILETDGKLNLIPFPAERPVTAAQLELPTQDGGYPHIVVSEGRVLEANLKHLGLDLAWLREELKQNGLEQNDVYLMTADEKQNVYLARKEETA
ncbi:MAG: DUF421 domain-containing protein [Oscillospiraceae bacterium]|nr:DUF421 domain-containing protein [Oscillospiraceae bacterium]